MECDYSCFNCIAIIAVEILRDNKEGYKVGENGGDESVNGVYALLKWHRRKRLTEVGDALERFVERRGKNFSKDIFVSDVIVGKHDA